MTKRILLIVPPNITYQSFRYPGKNTKTWTHSDGNSYGVLITDVPLGMLTLSAWLKHKFECKIDLIDFNTEIHKSWNHRNEKDFKKWFYDVLSTKNSENYDLIGFSALFTSGYLNLLLLSEITRVLFPESFIICGGNVATTMYQEIFQDSSDTFNALCYGEGELPLYELLNSLNYQEFCDNSSSWITKKNLEKQKYSHKFIENLDDIPPLDYNLIDIEDYHTNPTIKAYTSIGDKSNYITYMASRGCPFLCTFCSAHTVHGRKMRTFSIPRIRSELTSLTKTYNAKTLVIEDDMFLWNNEWATQILRIAQELNLNCFFPNALALYALDWPMLSELHKTGVRQLTLAVESGSDRVLKEVMKKPLKLPITKRVVTDCRKLGIYTDCNIILGMPGETKADIEETRKFLRDLGANWYRINVATPLAGSEMYLKAKEKGQIVGDIRLAGYKTCVVETSEFKSAEIEKLAYEINLEMNFLNNTDVQLKNYQRALEAFKNVIVLRPDHALCLFMIAVCHLKLGDEEKAHLEFKLCNDILEVDKFWYEYFIKEYEKIIDLYPCGAQYLSKLEVSNNNSHRKIKISNIP